MVVHGGFITLLALAALSACQSSEKIELSPRVGARTTELSIGLPAKDQFKAEVQAKLSGYRLIIEPLTDNCRSEGLSVVGAWQGAAVTHSVSQDCDYSIGLELGQGAADLSAVYFTNWSGPGSGTTVSREQLRDKRRATVGLTLRITDDGVKAGFGDAGNVAKATVTKPDDGVDMTTTPAATPPDTASTTDPVPPPAPVPAPTVPTSCKLVPETIVLTTDIGAKKSRDFAFPRRGTFTLESHYATNGKTYSDGNYPASAAEGISEHLEEACQFLIDTYDKKVTGLSDVDSCVKDVYNDRYKREWTPAEGGGSVGGGAVGKRPSVEQEIWQGNLMYPRASLPTAGTKYLACSPTTKKAVVVSFGYEIGPNPKQGFLGGFTPEVHWYLGNTNYRKTSIWLGKLEDQAVPYGPVDCSCAELETLYGANNTP